MVRDDIYERQLDLCILVTVIVRHYTPVKATRLSRLPRPDRVGQLPHQAQLVEHILHGDTVSQMMTGKATLRTHPDPLQCPVPGLSGPLGHKVRCLQHPLPQIPEVLQLRELTRDDTQDDILVGRELLEGLEAAGTVGIVLKEVRVDVDLVEQLGGDPVVATLAEVTAVCKVAAAEVDAHVQVVGTLGDTVIVQSDIAVKEGLGILPCVSETLEHLV